MRYFNQTGYIDGNSHPALAAFLRSDNASGISDDRGNWTPAAIADLQQLIRAGAVIPTTAGRAFLGQLGIGASQPSGGAGAGPGSAGGGGAGLNLGSLSSLLANRPVLIGLGAAVGYLLGGRKPAVPTAIGAGAGWWLGGPAGGGQTQAQKLIGGAS